MSCTRRSCCRAASPTPTSIGPGIGPAFGMPRRTPRPARTRGWPASTSWRCRWSSRPSQRLGLVRGFSQELSDRYRFAVDFAIHAPRDFPGSDPRNFHAHLLATTREVTTAGLAAKTTLELSDSKRRELGLGPAINELLHVRERWATATNEALRSAHIAARIDHRTLEAQGIDREPRPQIPRAAFEMERRGYRSVVAERMREDYEARVQPRLERSRGTAAFGTRAATRRRNGGAAHARRDSASSPRELAQAARTGRRKSREKHRWST